MYKKKKKNVKKFRKNFNTRIIKAKYSYYISEIVQLLGVTENTVLRWIKDGLQKTDDQQPFLIWGQHLKDFIVVQNAQRKRPCQDNELFCCKCQKPTRPKDNCVLLKINNCRTNMVGICEVCGSSTNRTVSPTKVENIKKIFVVKTVEQENLIECDNSSATVIKK